MLNKIGTIQIRNSTKFVTGSGSGAQKIRSWIRIPIRNKSFRILNTAKISIRIQAILKYNYVAIIRTFHPLNLTPASGIPDPDNPRIRNKQSLNLTNNIVGNKAGLS